MNKIKIGILTNQPTPLLGFDFTSYYVKSCTGKINKPADNVTNIISCFCDNKTARKKPQWVALSKNNKALRTNISHGFLWDHICPTVGEYKSTLFDLIKETLKAQVTGIHLDCIGFPRNEYCTCKRCLKGHKKSAQEWTEWKSKVVNEFVGQASKLVKDKGKSFSVTLLPDPCFGKERYGEDSKSLTKHVDFFIIPIYDLAYSTTYWLQTLAYDFRKQLEKPLYIELYAANPGPTLKNLLKAMVAVSKYVNGIILATHNSDQAKQIQEGLTNNNEFMDFLKKHNCQEIIDIIRKWKKRT